MYKKGLFNLNLIEEYGLEIIKKDIKTPLLILPTNIFDKLKDNMEDINDY